MPNTVSTSVIFKMLKPNLDTIMSDTSDGISPTVMKSCFDQKDMSDAYEDDVEVAGPGLASLKPEGSVMQIGGVTTGYTKRYVAQTFALRLNITKEAQEDNKYKKAIPLARMLKRSMVKTKEYAAALVFARATDSNYVGGDGVALASSSHTLAQGGTWSNTMTTPVSPSEQAVILARAQVRTFPDRQGLRDGTIQIKKVVFPVEQEGDWDKILYSKMAPAAGEFNSINVVNQRMSVEAVANPYWTNSTSNYCFITDAEDGLQWRTRVQDESNTWINNDNTTISFSIRGRWDSGWSDARGVLFVNA